MFDKSKTAKTLEIVFFIFVIFIMFLGVYIRVNNYIFAPPLWSDEMALARSIVRENWLDLFVDLECNQKAAPLYMLAVLFCTKIAGVSELSMRFVSVFAGVLSVPAFFLLCKRVFISKLPILISMLFFCFSSPLIFYSKEFKQFGFDLFIFLLLILFYRYINLENINIKKIFLYSIIIIVLIFLSIPMLYIVPAVLLAKLIEKKLSFKNLFFLLPSILFSYLYYILRYYQFVKEVEIKQEVWQNGFLSFSFSSFFDIFKNFYEYLGFSPEISTMLCFLGIIIFFKSRNRESVLISIVFLFSFIASALKLYPLSARAILFLVPVFIIYLVKPYDYGVRFFSNYKLEIIKNILISILSIYFLIFSYNVQEKILYLINNKVEINESSERRIMMKDAVTLFLEKYKEGEKVISTSEFDDFSKYYNLALGYKHSLEHIFYLDYNEYEKISTILDDKTNTYWILGYKNVFDCYSDEDYCQAKKTFENKMEEIFKTKNIKPQRYMFEYENESIKDDEFLFYYVFNN